MSTLKFFQWVQWKWLECRFISLGSITYLTSSLINHLPTPGHRLPQQPDKWTELGSSQPRNLTMFLSSISYLNRTSRNTTGQEVGKVYSSLIRELYKWTDIWDLVSINQRTMCFWDLLHQNKGYLLSSFTT